MKRISTKLSIFLLCMGMAAVGTAQTDTLRVMAYNVLYYGNGCQGPNGLLHGYLSTIVSYANPDILSLEKMASIRSSADDKYGTAPLGFADSIIRYALDPAFAGRYAYCPFTNNARTSSGAMIFYDQRKLGFVSIVATYSNVTDFDIYKLYYKDPALARTHDTTFLYLIPNHDLSGDENAGIRGVQIAGVLEQIKTHFTHLPNMINMGDFNVRNSKEPFYQLLTAADDSNFRFCDPPFFPDHKLKYPADWDHNAMYAPYFTTSTRASASVPNSCGTGGGGKNWYDHIFLSPWIVNNTDHIKYMPNSYRTIGNDGQRFKISINNKNSHINTSAPADVIEALYNMSNKYPVMADLLVTSNTTGVSPANPELATGATMHRGEATVTDPVGDELVLHLPADMYGQEITITCIDKDGHQQLNKTKKVNGSELRVKCNVAAGTYTLKIVGHHNTVLEQQITKL